MSHELEAPSPVTNCHTLLDHLYGWLSCGKASRGTPTWL